MHQLVLLAPPLLGTHGVVTPYVVEENREAASFPERASKGFQEEVSEHALWESKAP